jgi:hypothetical protein
MSAYEPDVMSGIDDQRAFSKLEANDQIVLVMLSYLRLKLPQVLARQRYSTV